MLTKSVRILIVAASALSLVVTGCGDASRALDPSVRNEPAPPVRRGLPPWSALPDGAEAYYEVDLLYDSDPFFLGMRSRYVFYDAERFGLQVVSGRHGQTEYKGRFERTDSTLVLKFDGWSTAGAWIATGIVRGTELTVSYNLVMLYSDFVDGTYERLAVPPE